MSARVEVILLAAGRATRMEGGDKTLEEVAGQPLLRHLAEEALASKAAKTHVVLPPDRPLRGRALDGLAINAIIAEEAHLGMSASLKAGLQTARDADAALVMLADMPEIRRDHINALITAFEKGGDTSIVQACTPDGQPGHPVVFAKALFPELLELTGDKGARKIIEKHQDQRAVIKLDGTASTTDLDTPEDWARWRALQQ